MIQEDDYTESLSKIIKRDFFPNLSRLTATNSYFDALESEDPTAVSQAIRNLASISAAERNAGSATPAASERSRREREMSQTPYVSRTPFGGRDGSVMETPRTPWDQGTGSSRRAGIGGEDDSEMASKRRRIDTSKGLDVSGIGNPLLMSVPR